MYDVYEDDNHVCLVMELMTGGELFDKILEFDHFPESDCREVIKQMIDAVMYCHEMNIIHRDIKPENLLIKSKEEGLSAIKITDFGLARFMRTDEFAVTTCGTPGYIAPEIINLAPYGKECDFWSIGVVLYIMLSGSPPFYEDDKEGLFDKIRKGKFDFKDDSWSGITDEAKDFISHLLVVEPSQRMDC